MKRVYKNLTILSLSGLLCLFLAIPASAQHRGGNHNGGGNGGGGHSNGGGGGRANDGGAHFNGGGNHAAVREARPAARSFNGANRQGRTSVQPGRRANVNGQRFNNNRANGRAGVNGRVGANGRVGVNGRRAGVNAYRPGNRGRVYARGAYGRGAYGRGFYGRHYTGFGYRGRFGRGGFFYHRGFYRSLYYPRLGFRLGYLPYGYYSFNWGGNPYFYSNGYYYQYDDNQYTVVEPPVGAEITTLPSDAQSIVINGQQYYELNGVYYVAITKDDGSLAYQIAGKDGELNTDGGDDQNYDQQAPPSDNYDQDNSAPQQEQQEQPEAPEVQSGQGGMQVGDVVSQLPKDSRGVTVNGQRLFVSPDDVYYKETRDNNNEIAYKIVGLPSTPPNN